MLADVPKKAPGARIDGVVVQEMVKGLGEAIVGFRRDPRVGPVVVVGIGGILAEVYGDVSVRPAPVDLTAARAMIAEVKGFAPLRGFRGLPEGDLEALAGYRRRPLASRRRRHPPHRRSRNQPGHRPREGRRRGGGGWVGCTWLKIAFDTGGPQWTPSSTFGFQHAS